MNFGCKANNIYLPLTLTTYIFLHVFGENLPFIQNVSRSAQSSVSWKKVLGGSRRNLLPVSFPYRLKAHRLFGQ